MPGDAVLPKPTGKAKREDGRPRIWLQDSPPVLLGMGAVKSGANGSLASAAVSWLSGLPLCEPRGPEHRCQSGVCLSKPGSRKRGKKQLIKIYFPSCVIISLRARCLFLSLYVHPYAVDAPTVECGLGFSALLGSPVT